MDAKGKRESASLSDEGGEKGERERGRERRKELRCYTTDPQLPRAPRRGKDGGDCDVNCVLYSYEQKASGKTSVVKRTQVILIRIYRMVA